MVDTPKTTDESPLVTKLAALVCLVRELSRAREATEIYEPALSALRMIVGVDRSSILLLDVSGVARFVAWRGLSDGYRTAVEGHFPWSVDDPAPRPILIGDIEHEPSVEQYRPIFENEQIRALAFIPLIYGERLVGKFMLYFDEPHDFGDEEIELANAVAYVVAFAIERARLYAALKHADERKDAFLATLGHELRNPLSTASAALALGAARRDDVPTQRKVRDLLDRSIARIVRLVDDLFDVSQVTRGVIAIDKQPVDVTRMVHDAVAAVQPLIASQRQELTLSLEPLWLHADTVRLEQTVTNLVHNASKYTPSGGHIRVWTKAKLGGVEIGVLDDGIGIEPTAIPGLFELFAQIDTSLAKTRGGLGIGLTIVRELVKLHGGTVSAASEGADRGSTFTIWLPERIEPKWPASPSPPCRHDDGQPRRVLIVDDNEDAATTLATLLQAWGHDVTTVGDGPSALASVADRRPDLVLLDLGLPGMSGYEVAEHLRASDDPDLLIVAVSGYGQPEDIARARGAGCDAHLAKPLDQGVLERLLVDLRGALLEGLRRST